MGRFFATSYDEGRCTCTHRLEEIERYARLDGSHVTRENMAREIDASQTLRDHYTNLAFLEPVVRCMETTDIRVRPTRHFSVNHVRGSSRFLSLAYRVLWELR